MVSKQCILVILPVADTGNADTLTLKSLLAVPPNKLRVTIITSDDSLPMYSI